MVELNIDHLAYGNPNCYITALSYFHPEPPEVLEEVWALEASEKRAARKKGAMRRGARLPAYRVPGPRNVPQQSLLPYVDAWQVLRTMAYEFEVFPEPLILMSMLARLVTVARERCSLLFWRFCTCSRELGGQEMFRRNLKGSWFRGR